MIDIANAEKTEEKIVRSAIADEEYSFSVSAMQNIMKSTIGMKLIMATRGLLSFLWCPVVLWNKRIEAGNRTYETMRRRDEESWFSKTMPMIGLSRIDNSMSKRESREKQDMIFLYLISLTRMKSRTRPVIMTE